MLLTNVLVNYTAKGHICNNKARAKSRQRKKQEILKIFLQDPIFGSPSTRQTNPLVIEN